MRSMLSITQGALAEYYEWLAGANHGDTLVYYTGDLQGDRQKPYPVEGDVTRHAEFVRLTVLNALADRIIVDAGVNDIALTQRRIGPCNYEYRATRLRSERERFRQANEQSDAAPLPAV